MDPAKTIEHWCEEGRHSDCLHVPFDSVEWTVGPEPSVDSDEPFQMVRMAKPPYVIRDTGSARLCRCLCHRDCPLSGQEFGQGWPDGCRCPGTLGFLKRQRSPDLAAQIRSRRDESRRRTQARHELRRRADKLGRDQVEELLDVIWTEHDLAPPSGPARPDLVDQAMGATSPLDQARKTVDLLEGTGRWIGGLVKMLRDGTQGDESPIFDHATDFRIRGGVGWVEVDLDADVQPRLEAMGHPNMFRSRTATMDLIELRTGSGGAMEVWERSTGTRTGPGRFGVVDSPEAEPFHPSLAAAARVAQVAVGEAVRMSGPEGQWRLYVKRPLSGDEVG